MKKILVTSLLPESYFPHLGITYLFAKDALRSKLQQSEEL